MILPQAIFGLTTYADVMLVLLVIAVIIWIKDKLVQRGHLGRMRADSVAYARDNVSDLERQGRTRQFQERLEAGKSRAEADGWYHQKERRR